MLAQQIRTFVVAVAGALVLPALALIPTATSSARGEDATVRAAAAPQAPKVPVGLVGRWRYGSISPTTIHDAQTGKYLGNARSFGSFLEFAADGSFKQYTLIAMNTGGWAVTTWTEEYGSAAFDPAAGTVALTVARGKYRVTDNRVTKNNYDRPMTDDEVRKAATTRTYKLTTDEKNRPRLELGDRDGKGGTAYQPWDS